VYADIGLDERGRINWKAPIVAQKDIRSIPYFILLDGAGGIIGQGDSATPILQSWMSGN
jgi:hypothetical protein